MTARRINRVRYPPIPDGYTPGRIAGESFVHVPAVQCEQCGALVGDPERHTTWHTSVGVMLTAAARADAMTSVIGPTTMREALDNPLPLTPESIAAIEAMFRATYEKLGAQAEAGLTEGEA